MRNWILGSKKPRSNRRPPQLRLRPPAHSAHHISEVRWSRCPAFEVLEQRTMLSVAQDLAADVAPYQTALTTALHAATLIPLVGHQLTDLAEFATELQNTQTAIAAQTQNITANGHYQVTVPLSSLSKTFSFNLGLDAFLQAQVVGNVHADINPTLTIGFDLANGVVSLDAASTHFDIGFGLSLPGFQGTFSFNGLLFTKAVDAGTNFNGSLGFNFLSSNGLDPHFSGNAHVLLGLSLSFVDPAANASFNPTFLTTLDMNWGFGATNQLNTPSIDLVNFGIDADSFLHGFLGDIVTTAQKYTKPLVPFIDFLQTPAPIISSFGSDETIGSLLEKGAGFTQEQRDRFDLMIKVINTVNTIDLSGGTAGAVIPFGTIHLTGNAQQLGAFDFDGSSLSTAIDDIFSLPGRSSPSKTPSKIWRTTPASPPRKAFNFRCSKTRDRWSSACCWVSRKLCFHSRPAGNISISLQVSPSASKTSSASR